MKRVLHAHGRRPAAPRGDRLAMLDFMTTLLCLLAVAVPFGLLLFLLSLPAPRTDGSRYVGLATKSQRRRAGQLTLRKPSVATSYPMTVVQLATAFAARDECSFALHDALLEAGLTDLANNFRMSDFAPDCWAIRQILDGPVRGDG